MDTGKVCYSTQRQEENVHQTADLPASRTVMSSSRPRHDTATTRINRVENGVSPIIVAAAPAVGQSSENYYDKDVVEQRGGTHQPNLFTQYQATSNGYNATAAAAQLYNVDASTIVAQHPLHPQHPQTEPSNVKRLFVAGPTVNRCSDDRLLDVFSFFGKVERINRIYSRNMKPRQTGERIDQIYARQMVYIEYVDAQSARDVQIHHARCPIHLLGEKVHKIELANLKKTPPPNADPIPPPKVDITPRAYLEGCACYHLSNGNNFRAPIQTTNNNSTTSTHLPYYHQEPHINPAELSQIPASYRHIPPSHEDMYQTSSSYCIPPPTPIPLQAPMTHSYQPKRCWKCNACQFPPWNPQPQTMITSSPPNSPLQLLQRPPPVHNHAYAFPADPMMQLMYTTTPTTTANFTTKTTPYYPPEFTCYSNVCAACQHYVSQCAGCQHQCYFENNPD
jgi:hypothetical protein